MGDKKGRLLLKFLKRAQEEQPFMGIMVVGWPLVSIFSRPDYLAEERVD